jgi:hypothetical protein
MLIPMLLAALSIMYPTVDLAYPHVVIFRDCER